VKSKTDINQKKPIDNDLSLLRPAHIEIDLDALHHNFLHIKNKINPDTHVMAVVKANAYGHGLTDIGLKVEEYGADILGVAFVEEAEILHKAGVKIPIAILYPDSISRVTRIVKSGLIVTVDSIEYLEELNNAAVSMAVTIKVLIKIETGMGRFGVSNKEIKELIDSASKMTGIEIIGATTNLADSTNDDYTFTESQISEFNKNAKIADLKTNEHYLSVENSGGFLFHHSQDFNLIRIGLLLYGIPSRNNFDVDIKPVMSLKSRILRLKKWTSGRPVGYSGSFVPQRDTVIATIGIGYADGYPWSLSNRGYVLIDGCKAPIIGKICMDAMMIDVTDIPNPKIGDEVVLLGKSMNMTITVNELASLANSFSYEFLSGFALRLPRVYIGG
jgi:alanine racemase